MVMNIWAGWLTSNQLSIIEANKAGAIWVYLAGWVLSTCTVLSLAEMASLAPTSGGQYHWVSECESVRWKACPSVAYGLNDIVAWPSVQKPLSYLSGWLSALGWHTSIAGGSYATGYTILYLAQQGNPSYTPTVW